MGEDPDTGVRPRVGSWAILGVVFCLAALSLWRNLIAAATAEQLAATYVGTWDGFFVPATAGRTVTKDSAFDPEPMWLITISRDAPELFQIVMVSRAGGRSTLSATLRDGALVESAPYRPPGERIESLPNGSLLLSGGGAHNLLLTRGQ